MTLLILRMFEQRRAALQCIACANTKNGDSYLIRLKEDTTTEFKSNSKSPFSACLEMGRNMTFVGNNK